MKARVLDKTWNILFVDSSKIDEENRGECDAPDTPGRQIRINEDLKGEIFLDTIVHELLHSAGWNLGEDFIEAAATDIASILWRPSVLRRILDDPLAKKISLELLHEQFASKDKRITKSKDGGLREAPAKQAHLEEAVRNDSGSEVGMDSR